MSPEGLEKTFRIFANDLTIARATPIFKSGDEKEMGNCGPISVLPYFSKILERIMYHRFLKYLTTNETRYKKKFGFREKHSTEHALIELIDQIENSFEKKIFLLLASLLTFKKAFDTVDHQVLIKKLNQ